MLASRSIVNHRASARSRNRIIPITGTSAWTKRPATMRTYHTHRGFRRVRTVIIALHAKARGAEAATRPGMGPDLDVTAGQRSCGAQLLVMCDLVPAVLNRNVSAQTQADAVPAKMASPVLDL